MWAHTWTTKPMYWGRGGAWWQEHEVTVHLQSGSRGSWKDAGAQIKLSFFHTSACSTHVEIREQVCGGGSPSRDQTAALRFGGKPLYPLSCFRF